MKNLDIMLMVTAFSFALWLCGADRLIAAFTDDNVYCEMVGKGVWQDWKGSYNEICKG